MHVDDTMEMYFKEHVEHAYKVSMRKDKPDPAADGSWDEIGDAVQYYDCIDFEGSKQEGKLVLKHGDFRWCMNEEFIRPAEECGTKSFLGFINDVHHDSDTCCAMLRPLELLGVKCDIGESFEFHVPINEKDKPLSIENKDGAFPMEKSRLGGSGNERPKFVPAVEYMFTTGIGKDYLKIVEDANAAKKPIPFQTREECDEFVTTWLKEWAGISSVFYRRGLQLVNVIYPEAKMKDIERYLVGWWS
jgi:hypothetical protein